MRPATSTRILFIGSIALGLTLAACGGGGGGGTGPVPGGGNGGGNPTPTPIGTGSPHSTATPAPTMHPTSSPAPTATPVPTATPTNGPKSITMLPDTTGRFGLTQIFDWDGFATHAAMSSSQIASEAPRYDSVWGAFSPQTWRASSSSIILSYYTVPVEDNNMASGHDLSWWQANHPDWILYACDSSGNPTHDYAWSDTYFNDVPLAFYMPQVQQYQMSVLIPYMQSHSYNALAADNTDLLNYLQGHSTIGSGGAVSGEYGCGTYDSSGTFHKRYTQYGNDPQFISDMVSWVQATSSALHGARLKLIINHPLYNAPTNTNETAMLAAADAMVDENGFTHYGQYQDPSKVNTASLVTSTLQWGEYAQAHNVAFLLTDYYCSGYNGTEDWNGNAPCSTDPSTLPASQVDWALSTYALVNEGGADVYITPMSGANYSYRNEYSTRYGTPCSAYTQISTNVYERKFSGALAIVNASGSPYTLSLPSGHNYNDIELRPVSGSSLTVNPADAYFLLTSNGCS